MSRIRTLLANVTERRIPLARTAALMWMAGIFALSSIPDPGIPSGMATPGHAVLYFVLGALLIASATTWPPSARALAIAVLVASAYGASDEFHQAFVPGRMPDVLDWATDTVGGAAGAAAVAWVARLLPGGTPQRAASRSRSRRPAAP